MAGRGFAPGLGPSRGEWTQLPPLSRRLLGELPARGGDKEWPPRTLSAWESWRDDPATQTWGSSDFTLAHDLAHLHADFVEGGSASLATEIRHRIDSLGLSPRGKRDLRLMLAVAQDTAPADDSARSTSEARRARLTDPNFGKSETAPTGAKEKGGRK